MSHTFLWACHIAHAQSYALKRPMLAWSLVPRSIGGQEIIYGRPLQCYLGHFDFARANVSALALTEWATLAPNSNSN